jgi:hypothetical protein
MHITCKALWGGNSVQGRKPEFITVKKTPSADQRELLLYKGADQRRHFSTFAFNVTAGNKQTKTSILIGSMLRRRHARKLVFS